MVAAIDAVRQRVIAEMTAQQPEAVPQRRLLTATQAAGVQAAPDMPVPKIAPLRPRGYRRVPELDSPESTLAPRSGVVEAAGTRKRAWPRKSPSGSPKSIRGTRRMQDTTLTEMMSTAVAAIRAQVAAKGAEMQEVMEQKKAGSQIAAMGSSDADRAALRFREAYELHPSWADGSTPAGNLFGNSRREFRGPELCKEHLK